MHFQKDRLIISQKINFKNILLPLLPCYFGNKRWDYLWRKNSNLDEWIFPIYAEKYAPEMVLWSILQNFSVENHLCIKISHKMVGNILNIHLARNFFRIDKMSARRKTRTMSYYLNPRDDL